MVDTTDPPATAKPPTAASASNNTGKLVGETLSATLWLGRAFNNISPDGPTETFNATALFSHLKPDNPILCISPTLNTQKLLNLTPARTFEVPENVDVHTDISIGEGSLAVYHTGSAVNTAIQSNASFSASYLGVSVSGSASYSYNSQYTDDQQYAFTSSSVTAYGSEIKMISASLNQSVRTAALALPAWSNNFNVAQTYYNFFSTYGTHVITIVYSGWRIQIQAQADNTTAASQTQFAVNVEAKYLSNSVDVSVSSDSSWSDFNDSSTSNSQVYGGKPSDIEALTDLPFPPAARATWDAAVGTRPDEDVIQVAAEEIGVVYQQIPGDTQIQKAGNNMVAALSFITNRRTTVRLQKNTDWVTFSVVSAGISMQVAGSTQPPLVSYDINTHTVSYGIPVANGGTFTSDYTTGFYIEFYIFNSGQPIEITLGNGALQNANDKSNGGTSRFIVFDGSGPDGRTYTSMSPVTSAPMVFNTIPVNSRVDWWNS